MTQNRMSLGALALSGNVRGKLTAPDFVGRFSLGSLILNSNDVGAECFVGRQSKRVRIADGKLLDRDGGGIQFSLTAPPGENKQ